MKKTATREEVERVFKEHSSEFTFEGADKMILNELFGEPYEPKVGDWVVIVENKNCSVNQVGDIGIVTHTFVTSCQVDCGHKSNANYHNYEDLRPATEEEIKRSQWKDGEVYEVWDNGSDRSTLRFTSDDYGVFWSTSDKQSTQKWDNFKRIVQC